MGRYGRSMLTADDVTSVQFSTGGLFRLGYADTEVDDWLDQVASTLRAYEGTEGGTVELLAEDAREVQFTTARLSGSYSMEDVDTTIDQIVATLEAHERAAGIPHS